ncbi:hypothetical protein D3C87_1225300 [compost metagenome]
MAGGSLAGPNRPNHALDSKPFTVLPMAGTLGNCGSGSLLLTPRILIAPLRAWGSTFTVLANIRSTVPPSRSVSAGLVPL